MTPIVAAALLLAPTHVQQDGEKHATTLVRVVDGAGKAVSGARVLFVTAPLPSLAPLLRTRIVEGRTNEHGRLRQELEPGLHWCAWAVHDVGNKRLASVQHVGIVPGRPLRIELLPWGVPNVSWLGLAAWRKKFGKGLAIAFLPDPLDNWLGFADGYAKYEGPRPAYGPQAAGFVAPLFRRPLPASDETVVRLPPLPLGFFYPALIDRNGGFLDGCWMMQEFSTQPPDPGSYDRARLIKHVPAGVPQTRKVRLIGPEGNGLAHARLIFTPSRRRLDLVREYRTDESGTAEIVMPARRDWQSGTALAVVPGFVPRPFAVSRSRTDIPVLPLVRSTKLDWKLKDPAGLRPGDLVLTTFGRTFPVAWDDTGKLALPSPPPDMLRRTPASTSWILSLLRGGRAIPLYLDGSTPVPAKLEIDLSQLTKVSVTVESQGGSTVNGGFVELHSASDQSAHGGPRFAVDRRGQCELELPPGAYKLLAWNARRGDGGAAFEVKPGERGACKVVLDRFRAITGRVVSRDGKPLAKVSVRVKCEAGARPFALISTVLGFSSRRVVTDDAGRFEVRVSSHAASVSMTVSGVRNGRALSGASAARVDSAKDVTIVVR